MPTIDPGVRIGHVHLKVADLERALAFYCGVLGLRSPPAARAPPSCRRAATTIISASIPGKASAAQPPAPGTTGLYHTAILYPTRRLLADALRRLIDAKIPLEGASDHGVSEALYLRDPDDNGVELYWDRPKEQWPKNPDGSLQM